MPKTNVVPLFRPSPREQWLNELEDELRGLLRRIPAHPERLKLPQMCEANSAPLGTAFTIPVDHRTSRTGITAQERATTIQAIFDPTSKPSRHQWICPPTSSCQW